MERIVNGIYAEAIGYVFRLIGEGFSERLRGVHFLTGTDPVFAGLHTHEKVPYKNDRRSYRNTAHVSYPWNSLNKHGVTTVVLPLLSDTSPYIIIHELGHCLDEVLGFKYIALPINKYARTNRLEAFAEAFAAQWFWLGSRDDDIFNSDKATQALFKYLKE